MLHFDMIMFIFAVLSYSFVVASNNDVKDDLGREAHSDRGALWFGPRLGKRSLNIGEDKQVFYKLLEAADALKFYYDQLPYYEKQMDEPETRVTKKVIFTPKLGRSLDIPQGFENLDFTPRLGRRLSSDMPATPADQEMYRPDPEQVDSRMKYFSPRLGRTMNFSPRLGRDLVYESIYPDKVRVARSTNRTTSQQ